MWNVLRADPLRPYHFRRQVPIGPYYADFVSHQVKLVIEIDGWTHGEDREIAYDERRSSTLRSEGYRVIRFSNLDVMNHIDGVFDVIVENLAPTRPGFAGPPSPRGGGRTADLA